MNFRSFTTIIAYILAVTLFLGVATYAVLFASGYKINWTSKKLEKTGIISIDSNPQQAKISINGKVLQKVTPASVKYLLPGTYTVRVVAKDAQAYENDNVIVKPGFITDLRNVILFNQNLVKEAGLPELATSKILFQDDKKLVYQTGNIVYSLLPVREDAKSVINLEQTDINGKVYNFSKWQTDKWTYSPDGKQAILSLVAGNQKQFILVTPGTPKNNKIINGLKGIKEVSWFSNNQLIYTDKNKVFKFDLKTEKSTVMESPKTVTGLIAYNNNFYYTVVNADKTTDLFQLDGKLIQKDLPVGSGYRILSLQPLIIESFGESNILRLWGLSKDLTWEHKASNVVFAEMYGDYLLFQTDDELWSINWKEDSKDNAPLNLATGVDHSLLLARSNYAFYLSNGKLWAVDIIGSRPVKLSDASLKNFWIDSQALVGYLQTDQTMTAYQLQSPKKGLTNLRDLFLRYNTEVMNSTEQ